MNFDFNKIMKNISGVTEYLRKIIIENGGDPLRETLTLVHALDGKDLYYEKQNLNCTRTQLKLVKDIWEKYDAMNEIVAKYMN